MVTETGLSDHHLMITTFLRSHLVRLKPKLIVYRSNRKFDKRKFLSDVRNTRFDFNENDPASNYDHLTKTFSSIIEKHAPLKQKLLRGNKAPFLNKELRQAIYTRSRFKNRYNKDPTEENKINYKKQRNNEFAELFNEHYINIVEKSSGTKPISIDYRNSSDKERLINEIIKTYEKQTKRYKRRREKKLQALQDEVIITHDERSDSPAEKQSDGINTEFPEKVITENVTTFQCDECDANYTRKNKLKAHMLKKHNTTLTDQGKRSKCTFPGCEETFYHKSRMISHLITFHGTKTNVRNLVFEDEQMFMEWKEKEELDKHIYFSKQRGDGDSKLTKYAYYVCQHDGDGRSHRKEGEPARKTEKKFKRGQIKTGRFCPARLTCHMDKVNKEIRVEYITSHSHAVNLENTVFQPIPSTIRQEINAKLSIGIPVNEVYKDLRDGMGNRNTRENDSKITRAHLVSKSNVTDIKRHIKYGRRLHPDDSTSTHLLVKKLEMEN
ncbi:uncharacterized protein LOC130653772 [Hydractinia symbiolongicarpus]|uniref:uncharacterized protein LOC130653772 n=1 Tax=Hydractinia symbiolongicarpus TaxID=13093 RepID=UPI00254BA0C9|nr:uncharacterized protein LOC130653772 [Hydractinia symbiolongicarpus]